MCDMRADEAFEEYPYIEEQGSFIWFILIIASVLLFFILAGITYSLYDNTISGTKQPILSNIVFNYSDVNGSGNGIFLRNAREMSDVVGKRLTGTGNSFDFTVSGNVQKKSGQYMIVLETDESSTIRSEDIKIYLTKTNGSVETELFTDVPVYSSLEDITIDGVNYKKLYSVSMDQNVTNFSQDYTLRMWIREGAEDYFEKSYSVKVNVLAESAGE